MGRQKAEEVYVLTVREFLLSQGERYNIPRDNMLLVLDGLELHLRRMADRGRVGDDGAIVFDHRGGKLEWATLERAPDDKPKSKTKAKGAPRDQ